MAFLVNWYPPLDHLCIGGLLFESGGDSSTVIMTAERLNPEEPFTVPIISNLVFSQESGVRPMIWFIA